MHILVDVMLIDAPCRTAVRRFDDASLFDSAINDERIGRMKRDRPQRPAPWRIGERPICCLGQTPDMQTFPAIARVVASEKLRRFDSEVNGSWLAVGENNCPDVFDIELDMVPSRTVIGRLEQAAPITAGKNQIRISRIVGESNDILTSENGLALTLVV